MRLDSVMSTESGRRGKGIREIYKEEKIRS